MKNIIKKLESQILIFDGSKGVMLKRMGLEAGKCEESWNIEHPEKLRELYTMYKEAGADVIQTNTFQANSLKMAEYGLEDKVHEINVNAAKIAKEVMGDDGYVAGDIGPIGKLYEPFGEMTFKQAFAVYKEQVKSLVEGGVDVINFETFIDLEDMKVAVSACNDVCDLPIIASMSFEQGGRTMMGTTPEICSYVLKGLGVEIIGTNCSFGPEPMLEIIDKYMETKPGNVCAKPNAGLPEMVGDEAVYNQTPEVFASFGEKFVEKGVRLIGGCCGSTPEHIRALADKLKGTKGVEPEFLPKQVITSFWDVLDVATKEKVELLKIDCETDTIAYNSIKENNIDYLVNKTLDSFPEDFDAMYINIDKAERGDFVLRDLVIELQNQQVRIPFIFETSSMTALASVLKVCKGRPGVILDRLPVAKIERGIEIVKKCGGTLVGVSVLD